MRKNIETYYPKYINCFRCLHPFWRHLHECFPDQRVFFETCFSEPLGSTPLDRFWRPLGHTWFDFDDLLHDFGSKFALSFKDYRATNGTKHTFRKASKDSNKHRCSNPNKRWFTFAVLQSRVSPKPQALNK